MIFGKILEGASTEIFKKLEQTESHLDEKDYLLKFRDMTIEVNATCSKVIFEVCQNISTPDSILQFAFLTYFKHFLETYNFKCFKNQAA